MQDDKITIIKAAVTSRIYILILQYISNLVVPDHDAGVFISPEAQDNITLIDNIVDHFLGGFIRWDAQYFVHISRYGYTYENSLAFFPFYPLCIRAVAFIIHLCCFSTLNLSSSIILAALLVNFVFFILSALALYELSSLILGNNVAAFNSAILFCFNPASIFFTAPYSECLFCYLTFKTMLNCIQIYNKLCSKTNLNFIDVKYVIPLSLSTITRSNGVLNIGFLGYFFICAYLRNIMRSQDKMSYTVNVLFELSFLLIISALPFIAFQIFCYSQFCNNFETNLPAEVVHDANIKGFIMPGTFSQNNQSWCYKTVPLAYSYVQDHYWNVGYLRYYQVKQIPNFLLAAPIIFLVLGSIKSFSIKTLFQFDRSDVKQLVFIIHATALTIFCILNVHIQVTTRMLCSASPVVFWICAKYIRYKLDYKFHKKLDLQEYSILTYFVSYFIIGTVLFSNFLPWT